MAHTVVIADEASPDGTAAESRTCGDLCVQLLCEYYGRPFDLHSVRESLQLGPGGRCTAENLRSTLNERGISTTAVRGEIDAVKTVTTPVILHVKHRPEDSVGHFVLLIPDSASGQLMAYDPFYASTPVAVTDEMLLRTWTGLALLVNERDGSDPFRLPFITLILPAICFGGVIAVLLERFRLRNAST
jgi:ABC-type bacteriocin/lantibiotic exporter with double-glycine peptidase domain